MRLTPPDPCPEVEDYIHLGLDGVHVPEGAEPWVRPFLNCLYYAVVGGWWIFGAGVAVVLLASL